MVKTGKTKPAIFSYEERSLRIDARSRPGRAQRVGRIEEPGRVAAMAQIKPNNSRPTAVTICGFFLPAAASFL